VTAEAITSGPLKDQPSFFKPLSPEGRDELHGLVMDYYDQFVTLVAEGRHMDKERVVQLADGRAYTGRQALALGLIDQIGGESDARDWLQAQMHVSARLPVTDVRARGGWAGQMLGDEDGSFFGGLAKAVFSQGVRLDGLYAIWHP
jgi:protease-4